MDERKAAILQAVVERYIETAQPVGSAVVARDGALGVSSATVRNEMAALEQEGYLHQPHTSAGRVPTEKGYRFFVDHLGGSAVPDRLTVERVRRFFERTRGEIEDVLQSTTRLLAELTSYAAVVVGPGPDAATVRSVQIVGLSDTSAVVVVVLSNGAVEKHTIELDRDVSPERLAAASAHLAGALEGRVLRPDVEVAPTGDTDTDAVVRAALAAVTHTEPDPDQVFVGGAAQVAGAFDAVETVRSVLTILEQQLVVVTLLEDVLRRGMTVAIGSETGLPPLSECSVVVAPYEVEGEQVGTIGVLGPTRMNYPQALAAVAVVGQRLGDRLARG